MVCVVLWFYMFFKGLIHLKVKKMFHVTDVKPGVKYLEAHNLNICKAK